MSKDMLKPGQMVQIAPGHKSGFGGRQGKVVAVSMLDDGHNKVLGALVDINSPLQVIIEPESLEEWRPEAQESEWIEFYI